MIESCRLERFDRETIPTANTKEDGCTFSSDSMAAGNPATSTMAAVEMALPSHTVAVEGEALYHRSVDVLQMHLYPARDPGLSDAESDSHVARQDHTATPQEHDDAAVLPLLLFAGAIRSDDRGARVKHDEFAVVEVVRDSDDDR